MKMKDVIELIKMEYPTDVIAHILKDNGHYYDYGDYSEVYLLKTEGVIVKCNLHEVEEVAYEGDILQRLQGLPSIPKMYYKTKEIIIMEYIDGISLSGYLAIRPVHTLQLGKLIYTLDKAYSIGIEPKDLSYYNLIVKKTGEMMLIDFGLYRPYKDGTKRIPTFLKDEDIGKSDMEIITAEFLKHGYI